MAEAMAPPGAAAIIVPDIKEGPVAKQDLVLPNPARLLTAPPERAIPPTGKESENPKILNMEDEFGGKPKTIIKPELQNLIMPDGKVDQAPETAYILNRDFATLSATRDLETGTPRTDALQEAVNKMTAGLNIKTKVVIMNKGVTLEAFTYPDGTIFVSQSLINNMDTMDQLMAVLGHEVSHVALRTTYRRAAAGEGRDIGVGWVHESACDANSLNLLERGRYNTLAFSQAIEKISGYERGIVHQGGLARSSQSIATHYLLDSSTSHLPQAPLPVEYKKEVKKTNLEILQEIKDIEPEKLGEAIKLLYPGDLEGVYRDHSSSVAYSVDQADRVKAFRELFSERLTSAGYSKAEVMTALIGLRGRGGGTVPGLDTPEDFVSVTQTLSAMQDGAYRESIVSKLFLHPKTRMDNPMDELLKWIPNGMVPYPEFRGKVPVDENSLLGFVKTVQDINNQPGNLKDPTLKDKRVVQTTDILKSYINQFIDNNKLSPEELTKSVGEFLQKARDLGIAVDCQGIFGRVQNNLDTNKNELINNEFRRVFEVKAEKIPGFEDIDEVFDTVEKYGRSGSSEQHSKNEAGAFLRLVHTLSEFFKEKGISDKDKAKYVEYISSKIDQGNFDSKLDILGYLNGQTAPKILDSAALSPEVMKLNSDLTKFRLKTVFALSLFQGDGPEFYKYMNEAMVNSGIPFDTLNKVQLINLCEGLIGGYQANKVIFTGSEVKSLGAIYSFREVNIANKGEIAKLPFVEALLQKELDLSEVGDIKNLSEAVNALCSKIGSQRIITKDQVVRNPINLFGDGLTSLALGRDILGKLNEITKDGIETRQYSDMADFIRKYYPDGNNKSEIIRELDLRYLKSQDVFFSTRMYYLSGNLATIGPEGAVILAQEITDIDSYRKFRDVMGGRLKAYLDGSDLATAAAIGDILTSQVTQNWETLLRTSNTGAESERKSSTSFARSWVEGTNSGQRTGEMVYDKAEKKFAISDVARRAFRSISDSFGALKNMTRFQRFAVAHKALTEHNGAFSSEANRSHLANIFLNSVNIKDSFINSVIRTGIMKGDAKFIVAPVADMIGGKLFEGLKTESVDIDELSDSTFEVGFSPKKVSEVYDHQDLEVITQSDTRGLVVFGPDYKLGSEASKIAIDSDDQYHLFTDRMRGLFGLGKKAETEKGVEGEIDPGLETLIRGVEASGPLGIRSLQLAVQFFNFEPAKHRRLSESFDKNPGMNKLVFWANLDKLAQDEAEGRNDSGIPNPAIEQFLKRVKLGSYLGGGSLQTTFSGEYREDDGSVKKVIIKRKNPSIVSIIEGAYSNASLVLEDISKNGRSYEDKEKARAGLMMVDLANKWCMADINDTTYEKDDDLFVHTIENYNEKIGFDSVYAPKRVFTESKVKSEEMASGRTANQLLNDPGVDDETKKDVVESMSEVFLFQMRKQKFMGDDGKPFHLVHSDPHVGNIMVDTSGEDLKLGVIDRSMYLKLTEKDVNVLEKLISGSNISDFAWSFVGHILDENKISGMEKLKLRGSILKNLSVEAAKQVAHGRVDKFALLQTMFTEFSKNHMHSIDVPLKMRLMIRNIAAFQNLNKQFGLNFEAISKQIDFA